MGQQQTNNRRVLLSEGSLRAELKVLLVSLSQHRDSRLEQLRVKEIELRDYILMAPRTFEDIKYKLITMVSYF